MQTQERVYFFKWSGRQIQIEMQYQGQKTGVGQARHYQHKLG